MNGRAAKRWLFLASWTFGFTVVQLNECVRACCACVCVGRTYRHRVRGKWLAYSRERGLPGLAADGGLLISLLFAIGGGFCCRFQSISLDSCARRGTQ